MNVDIRLVGSKDAERVARLARDTFIATFAEHNTSEDMARYVNDAFALETIRAELSDPACTFIWAEERGIPAGYAKLRRGPAADCVSGPQPVELERIYANPELIGTGVGKTLLHTCVKMAQTEGYHTLWLGVWEHNDRALEFYARQGFEHVGEHLFMLGNDPQTDHILQLALRA